MIRAAVAALLLTGAAAADPAADAQRAAADLRSAAVALEAAERAQDRVRALTATIRAYEQGLAVLREALRAASLREAALRGGIEARSDEIPRLLGLLLSMSRSPEATLLLHPAGPLDTARAGMLAGETVPALAAEATRLADELRDLEALRAAQDAGLREIEAALAAAQAARTALAEAIEAREPPPLGATDAAILGALAAGAETLGALAQSLGPGEDSAGFVPSTPEGAWPLPVAGHPVTGFREPDPAGVRRPGLRLAVGPAALVTAPHAGTVRYAGPFLDYGNVIVIEPAAGYLLVLAGLGEVFAGAGTVLSSGDPLGLVAGQAAPTQGKLNDNAGTDGRDRRATLYMELRVEGDPVDPTPWFDLGKE